MGYCRYDIRWSALCFSLTIIVSVMTGCQKPDKNIKVSVKNTTANTIHDLHIELITSGSDTEKPRIEGLRLNEYVYATRLITDLRPGESREVVFPRLKGGEGDFRVTGRSVADGTFSERVGYLEWYTESYQIEFRAADKPSGLEIHTEDPSVAKY